MEYTLDIMNITPNDRNMKLGIIVVSNILLDNSCGLGQWGEGFNVVRYHVGVQKGN